MNTVNHAGHIEQSLVVEEDVTAQAESQISARSDDPIAVIVRIVREYRRLFVLVPLLCFAVVAALVLLADRTYTASAFFIPQATESSTSRLASIASQFGIATGGGEALMNSPGFYRALLVSDEILKPLAAARYQMRPGDSTQWKSLSHFLGIEEATSQLTLYETVRRVRRLTAISVDRETGIVEVRAQTTSPAVSLQIVSRALELVNDFNSRKRRAQAAAEQDFIQGRLDVAVARTRSAENGLQAFMQHNRNFQNDPQLVFAYERLRRDVERSRELYATLAQAYEQASLNALRDTPVITTVQRPEVSPKPDSRGFLKKTAAALVTGLIAALLLAVLAERLRGLRHVLA
jgi:uncharacterized protein involved in exopolysaccharide biosynthesis